MIEALMLTFNINAAEVGEIGGSYFYVYALMQFPVGILMDRFGARRLLTFASLLAGLGVILFGLAPNTLTLVAARLLVALGSSFAFVGMLYTTSHWFPKAKMALLIGIGNSIGMLGGVFGEGPISIGEELFGWRFTTIGLGIIGLILSALIFIVVHRAPTSPESKKRISGTFPEAFQHLKIIIKSSQAWINGAISFSLYATTAGFAALWGVYFLQNNHGLSRDLASFANSMIYIGWILGGPLIGEIAYRIGKKKILLRYCGLLGGLFLLPLILIPNLPVALIFTLLTIVGICSSAQLLTFSFIMEIFSIKATGSASAFTNFLVTLGGATLQPFVGLMLNFLWTGGYTHKGIEAFSTFDYSISTLCFPLSFFAAFILTFYLKEKKLAHAKT
ncbi:MAG: hypothetical protein S4CHLAM123_08190 [Chlamydiales bacterium]|nr:hypothetical protein [Chlamydiales bacterium]